jgi:hypothetical protein
MNKTSHIKTKGNIPLIFSYILKLYSQDFRPQCHKTFEYSQLKYLILIMGMQRIFSIWAYLSLRMFSKLWIFSTSPFQDSDIWVENFLENTQKFYDGGARCNFKKWVSRIDVLFSKICQRISSESVPSVSYICHNFFLNWNTIFMSKNIEKLLMIEKLISSSVLTKQTFRKRNIVLTKLVQNLNWYFSFLF